MPSGIYKRANGVTGSASVTKVCLRCGSEYQSKAAHAGRRKFCSDACKYAAKSERVAETRQCLHCGNDFTVARYFNVLHCSKSCAQKTMAETKRTWYKTAGGYIASGFTTDGKSRQVLQHRHFMEEKLGRPLKPYENVHHINGVKDDNRLENLELWITKQPKGQREADIIEWAIAYLIHHGFTVSGGSVGASGEPCDVTDSSPATHQ